MNKLNYLKTKILKYMCGIKQDDKCEYYGRYGYCVIFDYKAIEGAKREERQQKMKIPKELLELVERAFPLISFSGADDGGLVRGTCEPTFVRRLSQEEQRMYHVFMNLITEFYSR